MSFHAQLGGLSRPSEALAVASSIFYDGMAKFAAGELSLALELFESCVSINQKLLTPAASEIVMCYDQIAEVYDKMGQLEQAACYYERARHQLASVRVPPTERSIKARKKRAALLRRVEQKLEMIPRSPDSKVHSVFASLKLSAERQVRLIRCTPLDEISNTLSPRQMEVGELDGAQLALEQAEAHFSAAANLLERMRDEGDSSTSDSLQQLQKKLASVRLALGGESSPDCRLSQSSSSSIAPVRSELHASRTHSTPDVVSIDSLLPIKGDRDGGRRCADTTPNEERGSSVGRSEARRSPNAFSHLISSGENSPNTPIPEAVISKSRGSNWSESGCSTPSTGSTPGMVNGAAESLAVAVQSAAAAVGAAQAAREAANNMGEESPDTRHTTRHTAVEEEDDDDAGPLDDRVEGAIEMINEHRDAMNREQIALDLTRRDLQSAEERTEREMARLDEENKGHLKQLAAYEEQKRAAAEALTEEASAASEHVRTAQVQASLRMAMQLQRTFDALVPYFVYRTVMEQELEDKRRLVSEAQQRARSAKQAYNRAMQNLEEISLDIQRAEAQRKSTASADSTAPPTRNASDVHASERESTQTAGIVELETPKNASGEERGGRGRGDEIPQPVPPDQVGPAATHGQEDDS